MGISSFVNSITYVNKNKGAKMFTKPKQIIAYSMICASLLLTSSNAKSINKTVNISINSDKDVVVEENLNVTNKFHPIIYAKAAKKSYRVNESIKIALKLKQNSFIYLWTISSNGNGYRILPNKFENYNAYKANVAYVVPERSANYKFVSDRPGVEHIYVVATNKKLGKNELGILFKNHSVKAKVIKQFVTKDIKVIAKQNNLKYQIKKIDIKVKGKNNDSVVNNTTVNIDIH